MIVLFV